MRLPCLVSECCLTEGSGAQVSALYRECGWTDQFLTSPASHLVTTRRVTRPPTHTGEKSRRKSVPSQDNTSTCVEFSSIIILMMLAFDVNFWVNIFNLFRTPNTNPFVDDQCSVRPSHPVFTFYCKVLNRDESVDFFSSGQIQNKV